MEEPNPILKRNSTDIGWDYGMLCDANNMDRVKCKLCGKEVTGGIYRIKQHIGHIKGSVAKCPKSSKEDQEKCKNAIEEGKKKKNEKNKYLKEMREEIHIVDEENDEVQIGSSKKRPRTLGPLDEFVSTINPDSNEAKVRMRQKHITDSIWKERSNDVHRYMARWVYEAGIPFHSIDNDSFKRFVEAVGQFGPGYQPPSQFLLRERLLKEEVESVKGSLKEHEEEWERNGCSIMTDAWTDRKRRSMMNLRVNSPKGTIFLSSNEDSQEAHTGEYIFKYIDEKIDEIGAHKIVQVVTDNASNNMAAGNLLLEKRPNMFWTSCATHTVNLMLEGIGKQPKFKNIIEKAKSLTIFIYAHHTTLAMMRKFTKKRDIVRPGVTRFASNFLTLQSLMEKKEKLRNMFTSDTWSESKWSTHSKGRQAYSIIVSMSFWNGVNLCLKVLAPLVSVLRLVDGDRKPAMGFMYGELKEAKEKIKVAMKNIESHYHPIMEVIDQKSGGRLDSPLHLAAYILNPYYFFKDQNIEKEPFVMEALITCVEKMFPDDFSAQTQLINLELLRYKKKENVFGKAIAVAGCALNDDEYDPVGWWSNYGSSTPTLQKMASRILALTASSSGCERNWSSFEGIHTKKRNRLDSERLNNLVYVQFNARILNKKRRQRELNVDVLISSDASHAQEWIVGDDYEDEVVRGLGLGLTGGIVEDASGANEILQPRRSSRNSQIRELHEEDFVSDVESEPCDEEFESDGERILEQYGEEEVY